MEDNREALGTLSKRFKKDFLRIFNSPRDCVFLHPAKPENPEDIPLILYRPESKKNTAVSISIDHSNINDRDNEGNTLLHLAVMNYHPQRAKNQLRIIREILQANNNIDPNVQNENRLSAFGIAAAMNPIDFDLIDALIEPRTPNFNQISASQPTLNRLLKSAILQDRPFTVKYLLKLGANPRATDEHGKLALHHAVESHNINRTILKRLELSMKDDYVGYQNMEGANLLHIIAREGISDVLENIADLFDINAEMENGLRPIVLALQHPKILKEFIKAGGQAHWTALKKRKPNKEEMKGINLLLDEIKKEREGVEFQVSQKDPGVQNALFNLIAYTGKLKSELNKDSFITNRYHLPEKYTALKTLVSELLTETNPEVFNAKLTAALKNNTLTENRSKLFGFYKLHGLFSKKRVTDDPNQKHYVKSTTEELLYDLKKAVEDAAAKLDSSKNLKH